MVDDWVGTRCCFPVDELAFADEGLGVLLARGSADSRTGVEAAPWDDVFVGCGVPGA